MKRKRKIGKKGSIQDILFMAGILLVAAVTLLVGAKVSGEFNSFIQGSDIFETRGKSAAQSLDNNYGGVLDNSFLLITVGLGLVVLSFAVFVRINPIFIVFFIIGLIIMIFLSGIFSNIYQEMAAHPEFAAEATSLVYTDQILTFLPIFVLVFGTLLMVLMYKLWRANL